MKVACFIHASAQVKTLPGTEFDFAITENKRTIVYENETKGKKISHFAIHSPIPITFTSLEEFDWAETLTIESSASMVTFERDCFKTKPSRIIIKKAMFIKFNFQKCIKWIDTCLGCSFSDAFFFHNTVLHKDLSYKIGEYGLTICRNKDSFKSLKFETTMHSEETALTWERTRIPKMTLPKLKETYGGQLRLVSDISCDMLLYNCFVHIEIGCDISGINMAIIKEENVLIYEIKCVKTESLEISSKRSKTTYHIRLHPNFIFEGKN